jgi:tetratricopeptide (TPR) repeat protein/DNA-binding CsgD family transcriptional regulator
MRRIIPAIILSITVFFLGSKSFAQKNLNVDSLISTFKTLTLPNSKIETGFLLIKHYNRTQPDSCAIYIDLIKDLVQKSTNKKHQAKYLLVQANHFQNTGRFQESVKSNEAAILVYEEIKDIQGLASAYNSLGLSYKKNSGDDTDVKAFSNKALEYEKKALQYYLECEDFDGLLRVYSNIGIIFRDLKQFKEALAEYEKGIALAKKMKYDGYSLGILKANLSQIYLDYYKDHNKAIALLNEALDNYRKNGIRTSMEHAYRNISYNYTALGDYKKGIENALIATQIANEVKDPHRQIMAYSALHHAQKKAGLYKESLDNLEHLNDIEHDLLSKEKTAIISEMAIRFETVKKDAKISALNADAEFDQLQKIAISIGAILLLMVATVVIFGILQKRKRELYIAEQERIIETGKLKNSELKLEHKQKELTAKILQLARKNEFLNSLETEVESLKENVDDSVKKASNKISRLIKRDVKDDQQWEDFAAEFSSLNQGFLDKLIAKYGAFTKSEVRLVSLLKMNLSSKDIADTLNISDEGIKKARYRLRKKLQLESDDGLQSYILSFA